MFQKAKLRAVLALGIAVSAASIGLVAPTLSSASTPTTLSIAEAPAATPNYILPFYPASQCTVTNTSQFQLLMYRPLYFFGLGTSAALQPQLSAGNLPVYSNGNKTVTLTTKGWKFADGQTVNGQSVMFFLNMYKADPTGFCTYTKGLGIPDQIASASASGNTVTIHLTSAVSPLWFTDNELATITPMADSWDMTSATAKSTCASGTFGAASTIAACKAVHTYLDKQGSTVSTFTDKMWQSGVDGPYTLTKIDNLGNASFKANPTYSGPQKAQIPNVKLVAFTSATAEQNQLQAGNIDVGYVDASVLTSPAPAPGKVGANWGPLASKFNLVTGESFSNSYMNLNFGSNPGGVFLNQLYVRQALQASINQAAIIKNAFKNYGVPTWSSNPPGTPANESGAINQPYPFNLNKAESYLTSNGWSLQSGQLVCTSPGTGSGQCGSGITQGEKLALNVQYASGSPSLTEEMNAIAADWGTLGIAVNMTSGTFNDTVGSCPVAYNAKTTEDICNWGSGWVFAPDYYPSGEPLWLTGAGSNSGLYSSATMDSLIKATLNTNIKLTQYGQYTANNLPALWDPLATGTGEVLKTLKSSIGFTSTLDNLTPEYFHF